MGPLLIKPAGMMLFYTGADILRPTRQISDRWQNLYLDFMYLLVMIEMMLNRKQKTAGRNQKVRDIRLY